MRVSPTTTVTFCCLLVFVTIVVSVFASYTFLLFSESFFLLRGSLLTDFTSETSVCCQSTCFVPSGCFCFVLVWFRFDFASSPF